MKKLKLKTLLTTLLLLCVTVASAQNYTVDDIYYNKISETEVEVCGCYSGKTNITIPATISTYDGSIYNVTSIAAKAFRFNTNIESIAIGENVTTIGKEAFWECGNLKKMVMGKNVTAIGEWAFYYCKNISEVYISDLGAWCIIDFQSHPFDYAENNKELYLNGEKITHLVIPNDITEIKAKAFSRCSGIESVTIPGNVTAIGSAAFNICKNIKNLTLGEGVTSIEKYAFQGCSSITSITIPSSVTTIEDYAFYVCYRLKVIYNNSSLNITAGADDNGCIAKYAGVVITEDNEDVEIEDNYVFYTSENEHILVAYIGNAVSLILPDSYKGEKYAIGDRAFMCCNELTNISIPGCVTAIGNSAFDLCEALTTVTMDEGISTIGNYAFLDCHSIKNITIPNSVTDIGNGAFSRCIGITDLIIGENVINIDDYAFYDCIGLTNVTIPNRVTNVGYSAFSACSGITNLTIGKKVTSIGEYAFSSCTKLNNITSHIDSDNIQAINTNIFEKNVKTACVLNVPAGSKHAYANTDGWKDFTNIVEMEETVLPKCGTPIINFNNNGLDITCDTQDVKFVTTITCNDANTYNSNRIDFSATYEITTYATKAGCENSESVKAVLCWIENSNGSLDIIEVVSTPVLICTDNGNLFIKGVEVGTEIIVYDVNGIMLDKIVADKNNVVVNTSLEKGNVAIVNIGGKAVKVIML